jgi:hypothetical protein
VLPKQLIALSIIVIQRFVQRTFCEPQLPAPAEPRWQRFLQSLLPRLSDIAASQVLKNIFEIKFRVVKKN